MPQRQSNRLLFPFVGSDRITKRVRMHNRRIFVHSGSFVEGGEGINNFSKQLSNLRSISRKCGDLNLCCPTVHEVYTQTVVEIVRGKYCKVVTLFFSVLSSWRNVISYKIFNPVILNPLSLFQLSPAITREEVFAAN